MKPKNKNGVLVEIFSNGRLVFTTECPPEDSSEQQTVIVKSLGKGMLKTARFFPDRCVVRVVKRNKSPRATKGKGNTWLVGGLALRSANSEVKSKD